jgi:epoxide hydrolase-like predicted phosphatase
LTMKGVIFDLGGVVVDWSNSMTYMYIENKYRIPAEDFKRTAEVNMPQVQMGMIPERDWMKTVFKHFGDPPKDYATIWEKTFTEARFNEQVLEMVKALRLGGYRVAALSNIEPSRARWLRQHRVDDYFDVVIFSCEVGLRKPDLPDSPKGGDIYELTLKRLRLKPGECLLIDDNSNCLIAAEAVGIKTILFKNVAQLKAELLKSGVDFNLSKS